MKFPYFPSFVALIFLIVMGCELEDNPSSIPLNESIELFVLNSSGDTVDLSDPNILADGITNLKLVAQIDNEASDENRSVVFRVSQGELITTESNKTEKTVKSNIVGQASTFYQVGTTPGYTILSAEIMNNNQFLHEVLLSLDTVTSEDVIDLSLSKNAFRSNGIDTLTIDIQLSATSARSIDLTVTESSGALFVGPSDNMITVDLDKNGSGEAILTSGMNSGTYFIQSSVGEFNDRISFTQNPISAEDVITAIELDKGSGTLKANGEAVVTITATIDKGNTSENMVEFSTGAGTFEGTAREGQTTSEINDVEASAKLIVGTVPGTYFITVKVGNYSRIVEYELNESFVSDFLSLNLNNTDNLIADGTSTFLASLDAKSDLLKEANLTLSSGSFTGNGDSQSRPIKAGEELTIQVGKTPGVYFLTLENTDIPLDSTYEITVERSYPDAINLTPATFLIDSINASVVIEIELLKETGEPSLNTLIEFDAYQGDPSNEVGSFSSSNLTLSNSSGTVTFLTNKPGVDKDQDITIVGKVNANGIEIETSISLIVND